MNLIGRIASAAAAGAVLVSFLASCGGESQAGRGHETALTETETAYTAELYDWSHPDISARGEGKRTAGKKKYAYLQADGYYKTGEYDQVVDGVRRTAYSVKITGMVDQEMMTAINAAVSGAQNAIRDDVSWVEEEKKEAYLSTVENAASVEPLNYSAADVEVLGHVLSVNILYLRIYNVSDAEGEHLLDETVDEGRILLNFDLRTGKVIPLSALFYDDVDYISLLARYMNQIGAEVGYRFRKSINGFPEDYDVYCLSGTGLVVGLADGNPFMKDGEETWFSVNLSDLIADMDIDPEEAVIYFDDTVTFSRLAFRVPDLSFGEIEENSLFGDETVSLPLAEGITAAGVINEDLKKWYQEILDPTKYEESLLSGGGSISAETQAPCGLVNVTVFIYSSVKNEYITLARCYDAKTGAVLKAGSLLTQSARIKYGSGVANALSFRVSNDFIIGIPEQEGVPEYVLTEEGEMDLSRFE